MCKLHEIEKYYLIGVQNYVNEKINMKYNI